MATYNHIRKRSWWDLHLSGGTVVEQVPPQLGGVMTGLPERPAVVCAMVEHRVRSLVAPPPREQAAAGQVVATAPDNAPWPLQATHFVDMMRNLGGEIDRSSIQAIAVGPDYPLVEMPKHPEGENLVSLARQMPLGYPEAKHAASRLAVPTPAQIPQSFSARAQLPALQTACSCLLSTSCIAVHHSPSRSAAPAADARVFQEPMHPAVAGAMGAEGEQGDVCHLPPRVRGSGCAHTHRAAARTELLHHL